MSFSLFVGQSVKFPPLGSRRMLALSDALFSFQAFHTEFRLRGWEKWRVAEEGGVVEMLAVLDLGDVYGQLLGCILSTASI